MRDVISAGLRGKSCRRAFSNGSIACPPGKCPVARVQSDTLRPADWTIGYSSPRSDIAVTTNYWTEIAAELGCAFHRRQFLPGNSEQLFCQPENRSITRVRRAIHRSVTRCQNRRDERASDAAGGYRTQRGPRLLTNVPGGCVSDKTSGHPRKRYMEIAEFADTALRRQVLAGSVGWR